MVQTTLLVAAHTAIGTADTPADDMLTWRRQAVACAAMEIHMQAADT
jgi:hypothetical protein